MAKRFTDSYKWKDRWFRALRPEHKLAWLYVLDNCDHAGVIDLDEELANFQIGTALDWDAFLSHCGDRIQKTRKEKIFLVGFVEFQYGKLSESCKPHMPVFSKLREHGISLDDVQQKEVFRHGNVTDKRREEVFTRDGCVCCYCGGTFSQELLQPGHIIPKTKGGNDSKDNLVAACVTCNAQKSDKELSYFIESLKNPAEVWKRLRVRLSERVFNTLKEKDKDKDLEKDKEKDSNYLEGWVIPKRLDSPEVRLLLGDFAKMRSRIKKPIRDFASTSLTLKRFENQEHLCFALETCIANDYQGLKTDYRPDRKTSKPISAGVSFDPNAKVTNANHGVM